MSIGVVVVIVAVLFVLGNIMGLKPKMGEVRVGDMRMFARKIDLHPKLVAMPDWLRQHKESRQDKQTNNHGMIAQYTVIDDSWQLPANRLLWTGGDWQNEDGVPISVGIPPEPLLSYIQGLTTKANSITIYWYDEKYAKSFAIKDEQAMSIMEQDLLALKTFLQSVQNINTLKSSR